MRKITFVLWLLCVVSATPCLAGQDGVPALDHVFVIVMENRSYDQIIGNHKAPFINRVAREYNLATEYTAVTNPSLPNYLAVIAGQFFGVSHNYPPDWDGASGIHNSIPPLDAHTIADQLVASGRTWKSYNESLPPSGAHGVNVNPGGADGDLYAVKHNPFAYFASIQKSSDQMANIVSETQLGDDLHNGKVPNLAFIVPDQCHDMHGTRGPCAHYTDDQLIAAGDEKVRSLVGMITAWPDWNKKKNIIAIIWDEGDYRQPDNHIPAIIMTSYGTRGVQDRTPYNHYSFLKTIEAGFGLDYLAHANDPATKTMQPMVEAAKQ